MQFLEKENAVLLYMANPMGHVEQFEAREYFPLVCMSYAQ